MRLNVRESENLLTPNVIKQVIRSYEDDDIKLNTFEQSAYANRYLGRFIDSKVLVDKTKSKRYRKLKTCYEDKSGTVKGKVEFCRRSLEMLRSLDDMSDGAIRLAERIADFIVTENQ